jgi:hypothetical protein
LHRAKEDLLAFRHFPKDYWYKIWSTNLLERVKEEIKQFTRDALIQTSGIWMFDLIESCKVKTIFGRAWLAETLKRYRTHLAVGL